MAGGARTVITDLGRPGLAHLGIPRSGALDPPALRLANRLVGNPEDRAGFEVLLGGLELRAGSGCRKRPRHSATPFVRPLRWPLGSPWP